MSEHKEAIKKTPVIPMAVNKRLPTLSNQGNLNKPTSTQTAVNDDFNSLSHEEKITYLKTKIARAEANLSTLSQTSAINRTVDSIFDLKRQLNMLSSDENKQFLCADEDDRINVFELITLNTKQVATKRSNALFVTGNPGVGKTFEVLQAIAFLNPYPITDRVIGVEKSEDVPSETPLDKKEVKTSEIKVEVEEVKEGKIKAPKIPLGNLKDKRLPTLKDCGTTVVLKPKSESRNNTESGYFIAEGGCTTAALYELLFIHRKKLLVFNDFDSILKDPESVNLLKAALDTYPIREISRMTKGNTFNSFGMSDVQMEEKYELEGKLPNQFRFTGTIVFISNLHEEKIDKALISRSLHVEVRLTRQQVVERMLEIIPDIRAEVPIEYKIEALNYLDFITSNYKCKFPLDLRQLIHTIDNRTEYPPEDPKNVRKGKSGNNMYIWQQMTKERLIERVFKYD